MFLVPVSRTPSELSRGLDRLFDDTMERWFSGSPTGDAGTRSPALDVTESERTYTVHMDLPGVNKGDVKVIIDGRRVSIEARSSPTNDKKAGDRVLCRERQAASYGRSFTLPTEIDQSESQARLDSGVLTLTLTKRRAGSSAELVVN
jgi:HSP20 family protein